MHASHSSLATILAGLGLVAGLGVSATPASAQDQSRQAPLPPATELVGTWARVDSMAFGSYANAGQDRLDICGEPGRCTMMTYDTLVFRADNVLLHKVIDVSPANPGGTVSNIYAPQLQWWIAADSLWVQWEMTVGGEPVEYVYDSDGEVRQAQPITQTIPGVRLEDDGQSLVYNGSVYRRVTSYAP